LVLKTHQFVLHEAEVAFCSEINTNQINKMWAECQFLSFKPVDTRKH